MNANTDPPTSSGAPSPLPRQWTVPDSFHTPNETFDNALAAVRRMAMDYAADQNKTIAAVLADANAQCADLAQELARARSQCETLRALLADTRPAIVARAATDPAGLDESLLPRIDAALA